MDLNNARPKFVADYRATLKDAFADPSTPKPVIVVTAPGGVGKTHMTTQLLSQHRVTWFGERNEMMLQIENFLAHPLAGVIPIAGPLSAPVPSVEKRIARADEGACLQFDKRVLPLMDAELGRQIEGLACRSCPDRDRCAYQRWKPSTDWLFAPHVWLSLDVTRSKLFDGRDVVVIDETPLGTMLGGVTFNECEIGQVLQELGKLPEKEAALVGATALREIFLEVQKLLLAPPKRHRVELRELVRDLGYQFLAKVSKQSLNTALSGPLGPTPTEPGRAALVHQLLSMFQQSIVGQRRDPTLRTVLPRDVAHVVRQLTALSKRTRAKLGPLADALSFDTAPRPSTVVVLTSVGQRGIAAGHFRPLPIPDHLPVVILDATAEFGRYMYTVAQGERNARRVVLVDANVDVAAAIYQTVNHRYPSATFYSTKSNTVDRLMKIVDRYKDEHPQKKVAVVVKQALFKENATFRRRVLRSVPETDVRFFWALRGNNSLEDYDALFVIGAPEMEPLEMETLTRAYMSRVPPAKGEQPFDYVPTSTKLTSTPFFHLKDRHGRAVSLEDRGYDPSREQHVAWRLYHHDEYIQAILRARPYDDRRRKEVFFLSNVDLTAPFPITLVREEELLGVDLWVRAKEEVDRRKAAGLPALDQRSLSQVLQVDESTVSKAIKKEPESWALLGY